jgi:hypothetical protein
MRHDVRRLAIRFADLWAVDPHQMVDEIYSSGIAMENMANPTRSINGSAQLHAVEADLATRIPEHRHELVRVIVGEQVACLETTVVAPLTHEFAPACVWWWLDGNGQVAAEVGWFDWAARSTSSARSHGTVPPIGGRRSAAWHDARAADYLRAWMDDPLGDGIDAFAAACTSGHVGHDELHGVDALTEQRRGELDQLPLGARSMVLQQLAGEGASVAMLVAISDGERSTRGTVVLTFDDRDRIVSERMYWDWSKALPIGHTGELTPIGSIGWRLDG